MKKVWARSTLLRTKCLTRKRRDIVRRVTVREEVSVIEVYWQLILRAGCARFVGHDTLPSQRAAGKPRRDVLHCTTKSNVRPPLHFLLLIPIPPVYLPCVFVSCAGKCIVSESSTREMSVNLILIEWSNICKAALYIFLLRVYVACIACLIR